MCKLCGKNIVGDKKIRKVRQLAHRILKRLKPAKLILFGSFARGDLHEGSDVDFLVVGDFKERFFDRIGKVLELSDGSIGVDALAYTPQEFDKLVAEKNALVTRALREGLDLS